MEVDHNVFSGFISDPETCHASLSMDKFWDDAFAFAVFHIYLIVGSPGVSIMLVNGYILNMTIELY